MKNPVFIIDLSLCNGCYACQIACKDEHCGNEWLPYAKSQPDTGGFWLKVNEIERGTIPKLVVTYIPVLCMHCDDAPCIRKCPANAIYKREDGLVIIDPQKCDGCAKLNYNPQCKEACPYNAIYWNEELKIAQKCTGCAHLLDRGWKEPRCVDNCPTLAIRFGEYEELKNLVNEAEVLKPEYNTKPRVFYLNLPKPFISGSIYDPDADECIEGVTVTAKDLVTGKMHTVKSDEFGDFWLKNLEWKHAYAITIEMPGYLTKMIEVVFTDKDVNLGDIALTRSQEGGAST